jgi:hypothetical protein
MKGMVMRGMVTRGMVMRGIVMRGMVMRGMVMRGMVMRGMVMTGAITLYLFGYLPVAARIVNKVGRCSWMSSSIPSSDFPWRPVRALGQNMSGLSLLIAAFSSLFVSWEQLVPVMTKMVRIMASLEYMAVEPKT